MNTIKTKLWMLLISGICFSSAQGQTATVSAGMNASGRGGSASFSVGQLNYVTQSGTNGSSAQGVQQPYEIFIVSVLENQYNIALSVYPNPTEGKVNLQVGDFKNKKLFYQLLDMQGRLIEKAEISEMQTELPMQNLPQATYLLNIYQNEKTIQSFKIIKH